MIRQAKQSWLSPSQAGRVVHTEIRLPRRRRGQRTSTSADVIAAVRQLMLIANDDLIAGILNRNGLVTGHGNRWTRERVTSLRSYHGKYPAPKGGNEWLRQIFARDRLDRVPWSIAARLVEATRASSGLRHSCTHHRPSRLLV